MKNWLERASLRSRLVFTYLVLIVASLGLVAWRIGSSLEASRFAETKRDQEYRAILAASAAQDWFGEYQIGLMDLSTLQARSATLSREINEPVVFLDTRGKVLIDSSHPREAGIDDSRQPEVRLAAAGNPGSAIRYDEDDLGNSLFSVAPVRYQDQMVGMVRLELPIALVEQASAAMWSRLVALTALVAGLTAIVSLLFAKTLSDPIGAITRATTAMANGDLKQKVQAGGPAELKQMAHSFNLMAERVSAVMEDQRSFVANAAHELRTPLTTIRLRAEALDEGAKDDPELSSRFLADIANETGRLSRLVNELLDLSRLESGLVTVRRESVDLNQLARAVADELADRVAQAGLTIQVTADDPIPLVSADPDQIRQLLIILLDNAVKFSDAGGRVEIELRCQRNLKPQGQLGSGHWLETSVADRGRGIPEQDLPHIFERFYRSDQARARESGGAGLGLAIAASIVGQHGGAIGAESRVGVGTKIWFALPI